MMAAIIFPFLASQIPPDLSSKNILYICEADPATLQRHGTHAFRKIPMLERYASPGANNGRLFGVLLLQPNAAGVDQFLAVAGFHPPIKSLYAASPNRLLLPGLRR